MANLHLKTFLGIQMMEKDEDFLKQESSTYFDISCVLLENS